jgi:hypothetical protein
MPGSAAGTNEAFALAGRSGKALESVQYEVRNAQGAVESAGATDGAGATANVAGKLVETLKMTLKGK